MIEYKKAQTFVVYGSEDGMQVDALSDEATLSDYLIERRFSKFRTEYSNTNYWKENECMIIRGEVVVPKQKQVVTEWSVD